LHGLSSGLRLLSRRGGPSLCVAGCTDNTAHRLADR
jgi:hypothetical protein